jgi:hypothetical protein
MTEKYSILVNSSDGFEDCWDPFFTLFRKYWPQCGVPILLNTEKKIWQHPEINIHCTVVQEAQKNRLTWSECLINALDQIKTPLVLYFQEDYFIHQPVRAEAISLAAKYMTDHPEIKHIALTKHGSVGPYEVYDVDWLLKIRQNARYRISTQAALWRVDALKSYLCPEENGWMFEIYGTWRANNRAEIFLCVAHDGDHGGPVIDYLHTGIIKGKWLSDIRNVFAENNIKIDYSKRGFYVPKNPFFHKIDVLRRLLEKPTYSVRQFLHRFFDQLIRINAR